MGDPDSTLPPWERFGHVEIEIESTPLLPGDAIESPEPMTCAAIGDPRVAAMRALYAEGDANGALFIGLSIAPPVAEEPADFVLGDDVDGFATPAPPLQELTVGVAVSKPPSAPPSGRVPRICLSSEQIAALPIDHRAGFLLAHIDGVNTVDEILDVCAMPDDEALFLLRQLVAMGAVVFGPATAPPPRSQR